MLTFVSIVHVLLCVFMIFVILLQPGKDAGMGAALGGGAATTAFGGRGAVTFLSKVTAVCATGFFLTSLGLSFVGLRTSVAGNGEEPPTPSSTSPNTATTPPPPVGMGLDGGAAAAATPTQGTPGPASVGAGSTEPKPLPPPPPAPGTEAVPADKLNK